MVASTVYARSYLITCLSMSKFDWACFAFFPVGATLT